MADLCDPLGHRAALERQLALLTTVQLQRRADAAAGIEPPANWRGPAAAACRAREAELRDLLRVADETADDAVRRIRLALSGLA
jgi:hypothetical protein